MCIIIYFLISIRVRGVRKKSFRVYGLSESIQFEKKFIRKFRFGKKRFHVFGLLGKVPFGNKFIRNLQYGKIQGKYAFFF